MNTASEAYARSENRRAWKRRWNTIWGTIKGVALVALVTAGIFGFIGGMYTVLDRPSCDAETLHMGFPHQWTFWGGCQIEVADGKWIPLTNYYYTEHP